MLAGLAVPSGLAAQTTPAPAASGAGSGSPAASSASPPLARFIPRENLLFYFEFSGLEAHAASWHKTAAYRLLTETPLGPMLDSVAGQLLDKALSYVPNRKLSGAETVTLIKHLANSGWVIAAHARPAGATVDPAIMMVFRGATSKEIRPLTSRILGSVMGTEVRPRIERKEGRPLVVVPRAAPPGSAAGKETAWVWWPEKDLDLVICEHFPADVDAVLATLDGKAPSATEHPTVRELSKPEGDFDPACIAFFEIAQAPKVPANLAGVLDRLKEAGIHRLDYRWGFDDDALMEVLRVVAPRPRKPVLALFDQPGFEKTALMPLPDGVDSFVELSIQPAQFLDAIAELDPSGTIKGHLEDFTETVQSSGKIDLRKDLLAYLGPRIALYIAPGRSATTSDESFETNWLRGINAPTAALSALSRLPKATLVAELSDPTKFGRALDGAIIAINNELKAQTLELERSRQEQAAQADQGAGPAANPGRGPAGRPGGARAPRRRAAAASAPQVEPIPGQVGAYMLRTPSDSPLRLGPPGFKPMLRIEGKYVVIAVAGDAAEAALKAVKRKDWKPSEDLQRACQRVPAQLVLLGVGDPRGMLPQFLASLPGTLQTMINSAITLARNRAAGGTGPGGGMNPPGGPGFGPGGPGGPDPRFGSAGMGGGRFGGRRGGQEGTGEMGGPPGGFSGASGGRPGGFSGGQGPGGFSGGQGPGGPGTPGSAADAMVELKVDPDKLPKADDIRSRLFLSTLALTVSDQDIRLIQRRAFPNVFTWSIAGVGGITGAIAGAQGAQAPGAGQGQPGGSPGQIGDPRGTVPPPGQEAAGPAGAGMRRGRGGGQAPGQSGGGQGQRRRPDD
jgi:hypothetical protein